jgi:hypothetical protein
VNRHQYPGMFDQAMRGLHADALASVSPATLARLRGARHQATAPAARRGRLWMSATACSALLAVALGVGYLKQLHYPAVPDEAALLATALGEDAGLLDENPDLYLWLASDSYLAME